MRPTFVPDILTVAVEARPTLTMRSLISSNLSGWMRNTRRPGSYVHTYWTRWRTSGWWNLPSGSAGREKMPNERLSSIRIEMLATWPWLGGRWNESGIGKVQNFLLTRQPNWNLGAPLFSASDLFYVTLSAS